MIKLIKNSHICTKHGNPISLSKVSIYNYTAFGLNFESEIELPEMRKADSAADAIKIRIGSNPDHLQKVSGKGVLFEAAADDFLINFNQIASYRILDGRKIIVDPRKEASGADIRLFLLGSAMAALLHQNNYIVIHGSCVKGPRGAIVITGPSSSGKSSLAAGLSKRGYPVLADDICAIRKNEEGRFQVYPGLLNLKIWKDVLNSMGNSDALNPVRPGLEKYFLPLENQINILPAGVEQLVVLSASNKEWFELNEIKGSSKYNLIYRNIYRVNFPVAMGQSKSIFHKLSEFSNAVHVRTLIRPSQPVDINGLCDKVESEIIMP